MKKYIMFFVLILAIVFSSYEVSYSQETGNFYFLVGTEGNERAIMYLHILGTNAYGSYYTKNQSIKFDEYNGSFDGRNLKLSYRNDNGKEKTITGTLSGDIVFRGKHNSKNVNLSLANTPVNSARIIEDTDDYFSGKKFIFNVRTLDNSDDLVYDGDAEIVYLDENIIIINSVSWQGGEESCACLINIGKEINPSDFISNSFLKKHKIVVYDNDNLFADLEFASFYVTPNRKIIFSYNFGRVYDEDMGQTHFVGSESIEFTFEEIKPFIKKNSPLDYLFN